MSIAIPELALVVLIGPSGSGKSTFARKHFKSTEILSSDHFRALVSDDEGDQSVTPAAFELLHSLAEKRLALGRLTVIDATNVQADSRKPLFALARRYHVTPVAIVFDVPTRVCLDRNERRTDRRIPPRAIREQSDAMRRSIRKLRDEGFRWIHVLTGADEADRAMVVREPLRVNRRHETGPFDIIGDVHGCLDELKDLLTQLGYKLTDAVDRDGRPTVDVLPPAGRKVVFVGDLVDRGPDSPGVLRLVMRMARAGDALCVRGNHDDKLLRKLRGREVSITHGLAETLLQLDGESDVFREQVRDFIDGLPYHYVLDGGRLVVSHAGIKEPMQGRVSDRIRAFCLYGDTTGESDEFGLPVRLDWAVDYRGRAAVVYGHTPTLEARWHNRTLCVDTGCVFGGSLSALRFPGSELVSVAARRQYAVPKRPLLPAAPAPVPDAAIAADHDVLDLADVTGRRALETRLIKSILIREGQSAAALEVMSRFAADPRWLVYLPPTMAPGETSREPGFLEHPREVFAYFASQGVSKVVCEQKHMGSRAIVVVCRDEAVAARRFRIADDGAGVCLTRTGRRFFDDRGTEAEFLGHVRQGIDRAGWWDRLESDWFGLDGELMPWSAKAQELLRTQYAATASAGRAALAEVTATLPEDRVDLADLAACFRDRQEAVEKFTVAYRRYCWPVRGVSELRFAPFHLLASEGRTYFDRDHAWHINALTELIPGGAPVLFQTPFAVLDPADAEAVAQATGWWADFTARGVEGMVVKPMAWEVHGPKGLVQPAIKVRGREYLRIIYGPEYTRPENLDRLRQRRLGLKQSLALREYALGLEALERFVRREPLRRVHECVFGVLALESDAVDPRL